METKQKRPNKQNEVKALAEEKCISSQTASTNYFKEKLYNEWRSYKQSKVVINRDFLPGDGVVTEPVQIKQKLDNYIN